MNRDEASVTATVYPEVNAVLQELLSGARARLGPRFVGMYLDGSLAIGDFDPGKSDLDFVVVTDGELPPQAFAALETMHVRIAAGASRWGKELVGTSRIHRPPRIPSGRSIAPVTCEESP